VALRNHLEFGKKLSYPEVGCQCRLNKGGVLFRRTRYQQGSLHLEERRRGPAVWVYRWWEKDIDGKSVRRKLQVGDAGEYPTESAAQAAADALRLTINNHSQRKSLHRTTVNVLWEHYASEELPLKEVSTQDVYTIVVKNWILPRWGQLLLDEVKTVEVERWLRTTDLADGTRAKIKNVMSALFSHAVRWEFCGRNPISSGIQVGTGGKRGPSVGVRINAKRQKAPLVLSPVQVKQGLAELQFRDQLLVFLIGALGTRRGEVGALRWTDCDFANQIFYVQHSYYWRREGYLNGDQNGSICETFAHASGAEKCPTGVESTELVHNRNRFCVSVCAQQGQEATRPRCGAEPNDQAGVRKARNHRCGLAYVSTFSRKYSRGHGRTSAHHPRLLASQQPQRHQPILAGNIQDQASRSGEASRCDSTHRIVVSNQVNPGSVNLPKQFIPQLTENVRMSVSLELERLLDPNGPRFLGGGLGK